MHMPLSAIELARAKEAVAGVLEDLGLDAYLFDLRLQDGPWELHVDCAADGGWQSLSIPVEVDQLLASRRDSTVRARLLRDWESRFSACKGNRQHPRRKCTS
jgi:hypothetical protein